MAKNTKKEPSRLDTGEREMRELPIALSEKEILARGELLAKEVQVRERVDTERKEAAAGFRERLDKHDAEIERLAEEVESGAETQDVECALYEDGDRMLMQWVRLDTGEVIEERPMSAEERQLDIGCDQPPDPENNNEQPTHVA